MKITNLKDYMRSPLQISEMSLTKSNSMGFHWADYSKACELHKEYFRKNKYGVYDKLNTNIDTMIDSSIWVKADDHVYTFSLFQVYEALIFDKKLPGANKGKVDLLEMSFIGPSGPFKEGYLSECVNNDVYAKFIFQYLLSGQLSLRDFRIRCHGKVVCYYEKMITRNFQLDVTQITTDGILFVCHDKNIKKKLAGVTEIRPLIDVKIFSDAIGCSLNELGHKFDLSSRELFHTYDDRCEYTVDCKDLQFYTGHNSMAEGVDYIYCSFESVKGHNQLFQEILKSFIDSVKDKVDEQTPKAS